MSAKTKCVGFKKLRQSISKKQYPPISPPQKNFKMSDRWSRQTSRTHSERKIAL